MSRDTDDLSCEGVTSLNEGDSTRLSCRAPFIGQIMPNQLSWLRSTDPVKDDDEQFGIRLARRDVTVTSAGRHDDGVVYRCLLRMNDVTEECSVTLNVSCVYSKSIKSLIIFIGPGNGSPMATSFLLMF